MKKALLYVVLSFAVISVNAVNFVPEPLPANDLIDLSNESAALTNHAKRLKSTTQGTKKFNLQSFKAPRQENIEREQLDSIVTTDAGGNNISKTEYHYDANGLQLLSANYTWNTTVPGWQGANKYEYVYGKDELNNTTLLRTYFTWNAVDGVWKNVTKEDIVFQGSTDYYKYRSSYSWDDALGFWMPVFKLEQLNDEEGFDVMVAEYSWNNEAQLWIGNTKEGYILSDDGTKSLSEISYSWGESELTWIEKNISNFDANGNRIMQTKYSWNDGSWQGVYKEDFEYTFNDGITIKTHYEWDNGLQDWKKLTKEASAFDSNDNRILYAHYQWNSNTNKWEGTTKEELAYDSFGNVTGENYYSWNVNGWWDLTYYLISSWDNSSGDWQMVSKIEYTYNEFGLELLFEQMYRSNSINPWIPNYTWKRETSYDADNNISAQVFYDWDEANSTWKYYYKNEYSTDDHGNITLRIRSNWSGSAWEESQRATYYYSIISGTESPAYTISLHTYPNPVRDLLIVDSTTSGKIIRISDMNGRVISSFATEEGQTKINISSMSKGVYFVEIDGETVKVVKN
jgi:hypothetical protein